MPSSITKTYHLNVVPAGLPLTATPTFSPGAGSYSGTQTVAISCATPSSTIYYTTDGSTPTTGSTVYSATITVGANEVVKAMATATSHADSAVGSASYIIGGGGGNLMMYSNGVIDTSKWPTANDYSYGATPAHDYLYTGSPQPGHTYSNLVHAASGWQQATNWAVSPPNGQDISQYTYLQFDIKLQAGSNIGISGHATRSTGNDINVCAYCNSIANIPGIGTLTPGVWLYAKKMPTSFIGLLGSGNYYKYAMQDNGNYPVGLSFQLDNIQWVAGNLAWVHNGDPEVAALQSGWTDASTGLTANYAFNPTTVNSALYSCNQPPQANSFTGTLVGPALTVSGLTDVIHPGQQLVYFQPGAQPVVWGAITSGSGGSWNVSSPGGNFSGQSCCTTWLQSQMQAIKLTMTAAGAKWRVNYASGFDLTPHTHLTFAITPTKTGNAWKVQYYDTSGAATGTPVVISPGSLTYCDADYGINWSSGAPNYTVYEIPLADLGVSGATIGGFSIQDNSGNTTNVAYLSAPAHHS
jgi:hypothetical protein